MAEILGTRKTKYVITCQGVVSQEAAPEFARKLINLCGMTPARPGRIDAYPYEGGGGKGYTGFFPLKESYLIMDVYDDLNETEILLSTCKPERISRGTLMSFIIKEIGPIISE